MRIFTASLATETNTFSPVPTDRASFEMAFYAAPGKHPETPTLCSSPIVALRRRAERDRLTVIEGTATWAEPGGLVQRKAYEDLRDEILGQLSAAMPVDAVILGLHGAMVAQGYDDCEGDLLEARSGNRRARHCHRFRARPAQPSDGKTGRGGGHPGRVPRVSAYRLLRARRACGRTRACRRARRNQAGHLDLRLPDDRRAADQPRADALLRRPVQGAAGQGRHPFDLGHPRFHGGRCARDGYQDHRRHRQRQGQRRRAGRKARHGTFRHARKNRDEDGRRR